MFLPKNAPSNSVLQFFSVVEKPAAPIGPPGPPLPVPPARLAHLPAPPRVQHTVELRPTLNAQLMGQDQALHQQLTWCSKVCSVPWRSA
eukprot:361231-Chlamydomonas_euryale.AAC.1